MVQKRGQNSCGSFAFPIDVSVVSQPLNSRPEGWERFFLRWFRREMGLVWCLAGEG